MRYQAGLVAVATTILGITFIRPLYLRDQLLHDSPLVLVLPLLLLAASRHWFSNRAMTCIIVFLVLHMVGARYIYSTVPYDAWSSEMLGWSPVEHFGLSRNHYDRLVHFAFGVLGVAPITEAAIRYGALPRKWAIVSAVAAIMGVGAIYEIFEWVLTMAVAPQMADAYNGQQGDVWDAQKDMAIALVGAVWAVAAVGVWRRAFHSTEGG